jgi:hypothetical protein
MTPAATTEEPETRTSNKLAVLLDLIPKAHACATRAELDFLAVNLTHDLVPYAQAALYFQDEGVVAVSGVSGLERNSPFVIALSRTLDYLLRRNHAGPVDAETLPDDLRAAQTEWLPAHGYAVPLREGAAPAGYWVAYRDSPFEPDEIARLQYWMGTWLHVRRLRRLIDRNLFASVQSRLLSLAPAPGKRGSPLAWGALWGRRIKDGWRTGRLWLWLLLILGIGGFPVRLSVMAPAEVVPVNPTVIRAPIDGVLESFFVTPNVAVTAGQRLFTYDSASLVSRLEVAKQALASAEAEYRQAATLSLNEDKSKATLALLEAKIAQKRVEYDYLAGQHHKSVVSATVPGVVLLDDPTEFIGKPVTTGERVLSIASERDVEIQAWLAPGDMIDLEPDDEVKLYLNPNPFNPARGKVRYAGYEPVQQPDGQFAYRLRATFTSTDRLPRLGLKGVAQVSGRFVPLAYWVFRKPLALIRQTVGL